MKLSPEQEQMIMDLVDDHRFSISTLKDDIVDHICCVVEFKLQKGLDFKTALDEAVKELAPQGLERLEEETFYLLNSDKIVSMKKLTYLVGLLSTMATSIGLTLKVLRISEIGGALSTYGLLTFLLLFLPMFAVNHFKFSLHRAQSEKFRMAFGIASAVLVGLAVVMKINHLQGADIVLLAGAIVFSFGFLPFLFFNLYKKAVSKP